MMHDPPHPGEMIRSLCLEPLGLPVTAAALALGVTRKTLSELLNAHAGISPEMALRLSKVFGRSPEAWLHLQAQYEIWHAQRNVDLSTLGSFQHQDVKSHSPA